MSGSRKIAPLVALVATILAVAFIVVLVVASPDSQTDATSPLLGNPAPSVVTTTIDDQPFDLARRKGSWVVLNFFNSTCVPCRAEHPDLLAFANAQSSSEQPVELYTVVNDDSDEAVRAFFDEMMSLGVEGMMLSPGYAYDKAPDQSGFLKRRETNALFEMILSNRRDGKRRWGVKIGRAHV